MRALTVVLGLALVACDAKSTEVSDDQNPKQAVERASAPADDTEASPQAYAASEPRVDQDGRRTFGADLDEGVTYVELATLLDDPKPYVGQDLRTTGTVERVCQRKGCWLELKTAGGAGLRVPMAQHAFYIPQNAVGRRAEVQGTLVAGALPDAVREHIRAEGAEQLGPLALQATSVCVTP